MAIASGCGGQVHEIHQDKDASRVRVDIRIDAAGTRNARPPRAQSLARLNQFAFENERTRGTRGRGPEIAMVQTVQSAFPSHPWPRYPSRIPPRPPSMASTVSRRSSHFGKHPVPAWSSSPPNCRTIELAEQRVHPPPPAATPMPVQSRWRAAVGCNAGILLMPPRVTGRSLSPIRKRSRVAPVSTWIFQPVHRAPATTKRDQDGPSLGRA